MGDFAIARTADGDVLQLCATMTEANHGLATCFAPTNRATHALCDNTEKQIFGVCADLCAETAAHVGGLHAYLRHINTVCSSDGTRCALRMLSGQPLRESAIRAPCSSCTTHFKWAWCNTLIHVATLDDNFATSEEVITCVVRHAKCSGVKHDIASTCVVQESGACHCLFHINECFEHVVINDDCF